MVEGISIEPLTIRDNLMIFLYKPIICYKDSLKWQVTFQNKQTNTRFSPNAICIYYDKRTFEPWHDKTNKVTVRPPKTQISLGIRPVWSESSLCGQWVAKDPWFLHADSEDSDLARLIWVFAGRTATLSVLSCRGSHLLWVCMHFLNCYSFPLF